MVRLRMGMRVAVGLVAATMLVGCFGSPFDKGDGSGTGTGRPSQSEVDRADTGGLGSPHTGGKLIGPGELSPKPGSAPAVGPK